MAVTDFGQLKESCPMHFETEACGITLLCDVIKMGKDWVVTLQDNRCGHIGCTVLSLPRPSLTGNGMSATSSVLNCLGHQDGVAAVPFADAVAARTERPAVCVCGIHLDCISPDQIQQILDACEELKRQVLCAVGEIK